MLVFLTAKSAKVRKARKDWVKTLRPCDFASKNSSELCEPLRSLRLN